MFISFFNCIDVRLKQTTTKKLAIKEYILFYIIKELQIRSNFENR